MSFADNRICRFTPEKLSHVGFLQERHEDFNKYEDFRKTGAISSDAADLVCLPSNPDSPDVMDKSRKRKQNSQIHHNGDMQILDVSKERPDYREVQNAGKINGPYGAYPMHEDCCAVANHYIVAANRNGDSLMTMEGVSSWLNLYRDLQGRWSPQQKGVLLAHQYPHGYYGAAEFQGQDWKREEASKVGYFPKSPKVGYIDMSHLGLRSITYRHVLHHPLYSFETPTTTPQRHSRNA